VTRFACTLAFAVVAFAVSGCGGGSHSTAQGSDHLEIDYGPADSGRLDGEGICHALVKQGWKRRPPWEGLDGPWPPEPG